MVTYQNTTVVATSHQRHHMRACERPRLRTDAPIMAAGVAVDERPALVLPASILATPPSCAAGMKPEEEVLRRMFGCEMIQEASIMLDL